MYNLLFPFDLYLMCQCNVTKNNNSVLRRVKHTIVMSYNNNYLLHVDGMQIVGYDLKFILNIIHNDNNDCRLLLLNLNHAL